MPPLTCPNRDEDVTETMYKDTKPSPRQQNGISEELQRTKESKINIVCDAVLRALESRRSTNLQNIITANVSKQPPALDDGLQVVAQLMGEDESLAEAAAEHICFLVDVNRLYDHALGLYDLDLALLIAQKSQRDPREYVPFVQSLHALPEARRKHVIDDHLGKREKALVHLHSLNIFDELKSYVLKHTLYSQALELFRFDAVKHDEIFHLYAEHLEATSKFHQAGLAYESLGDYAKASSCYRAAGPGSWRECLHAFQRSQQQQTSSTTGEAAQSAQADLATRLADALTEAKDHASAAEIYTTYLYSPEQAVQSFCKGYHFSQALQLCTHHYHRTSCQKSDPLVDVVDAGLAEATGSSTEFLADCKAQLAAQIPRILELRERAKKDPLAFYESNIPGRGGEDLPDDVSVTVSSRISTTSASLFTRYTGKGSMGTAGTGASRASTARNRRREENKRARGRKGTVYEEEYLVNSVRRLVERVDGTARMEVGRLVEGLVRRGMLERARAVEALMGEVVEYCMRAVGEVWGEDGGKGHANKEEGGGRCGQNGERWMPRGGDAVLAEVLEERGKKQEPPLVKKFVGLGLLA